MYLGRGLVYCVHKEFNEAIHLGIVVTVVGDFKSVVQVNMSCKIHYYCSELSEHGSKLNSARIAMLIYVNFRTLILAQRLVIL